MADKHRFFVDYPVEVLARPAPSSAPAQRDHDTLRILGIVTEQRHMPGGHQHNQLTHAGDVLNLAGRVDLGGGESFVSSGRLDPGDDSDDLADVLWAVVDTPNGRRVRLGVLPVDDVKRWRAGNKGGTVDLSPSEVRELRDKLTEASAAGKAAAKAADTQWNKGSAPTDPRLLGTDPVAEGVMAVNWGEVTYDVYVTDDDPTSFKLSLNAGNDDAEVGAGLSSKDAAGLDPKDASRLIGELNSLVT